MPNSDVKVNRDDHIGTFIVVKCANQKKFYGLKLTLRLAQQRLQLASTFYTVTIKLCIRATIDAKA